MTTLCEIFFANLKAQWCHDGDPLNVKTKILFHVKNVSF